MATNPNGLGFPTPNAPLTGIGGIITSPWLQFLIALWNRTGGAVPSGQVNSVQVAGNDGITATVVDPTTDVQITLGLGSITPTSVTASGAIVGSNVSGTNTGNVSLSGENYLTIVAQVVTVHAVNLSGTNVTGILDPSHFPALSGDVTNTTGSVVTTISAGAISTGKIANNAVTNTKMANGTNNSLAGYDNTGAFSDITTGAQLAISAGVLNTVGISVTITTAKLTTGGTNGSMTFTNGILTAQSPAT